MLKTIRMLVLCASFLSTGSLVFAQKKMPKGADAKINDTEDVYSSPKDRKYHKLDCPLLADKKAKKISKKKLLAKGLVPCPVCFRTDFPVVPAEPEKK